MGTDVPSAPPPPPLRRTAGLSRVLQRSPSSAATLTVLVALDAVLAGILWRPDDPLVRFLEVWAGVLVLPALAAALLTGPLASALGGRLIFRRSLLLALTATIVAVPLLALWRALAFLPAVAAIPPGLVVIWSLGPMLWFREISLYGVSNPHHPRSLPAAALQPVLVLVGVFAIAPPGVPGLLEAGAVLVLAFLCCALLIRTTERPIRREFGVSGMSLIRPILDHINTRDPTATHAMEAFFARHAIPANLRVGLVSFRRGGHTKATIVLPTVHPGPFAALGASDLPRKLTEALGPDAGTVFVPHTPCDHDLDLPTSGEVDRVADGARQLMVHLAPDPAGDASPLVEPHAGSLARAQLLGNTAIVLVSQAPAPTDDIAYAVADRLIREVEADGVLRVALIDAHNSYVEDAGDVAYGTPIADRLLADARAAIAEALRRRVPGPLEVGVAERTGYTTADHGIGPRGIRALAVRAAGRTAAYVLIDGNNLILGMRQPILDRLKDLVDDAEVLTTDNHIVHEVDGGINPVGERYPVGALADDVRELVARAVADLTVVEVASGRTDVAGVPVLGPGYTARLLTSLADTLSVFANAFLTTYLLLVASSTVVLAALR